MNAEKIVSHARPTLYQWGKSTTCLAAVFCSVLLTNCATVLQSEPRLSNETPVAEGREVEQVPGTIVELGQEGTVVRVRASKSCQPREVTKIRRTFERKNNLRDPSGPALLAGLGGVAVVGGGVLVVDSVFVHPEDKHSRQYNPYGPGIERGVGLGVGVVGLLALGTAAIDGIRASGSVTTTEMASRKGRLLGVPVACENAGAPELVVLIQAAGLMVSAGTTTGDGTLEVDLLTAFPKASALPKQTTARVLVDGVDAGEVSLVALHQTHDERSWRLANVPLCRAPKTSRSCDDLRAYLNVFPSGKYASQARQVLEEAAPKLAECRDDEAWQDVQNNACGDAAEIDLDTHSGACDRVAHYLRAYPDGKYRKEANAKLKRGLPLVSKLEAAAKREAKKAQEAEDRKARAAEAAEKETARKLVEESARDRKMLRDMQAREEARLREEERKEREKERNKCVAICQYNCNLRPGRSLDLCISSCVTAECAK